MQPQCNAIASLIETVTPSVAVLRQSLDFWVGSIQICDVGDDPELDLL